MDDGSLSPAWHVAPMFGLTRLTYHHNNLDFQFYALYNAKRDAEDMLISGQDKTEFYVLDENGEVYSPGWYTLNFKAIYRIN